MANPRKPAWLMLVIHGVTAQAQPVLHAANCITLSHFGSW